MSPNITMGGEGLAKKSRDKFVLVVSLVKVNKKPLSCHARGRDREEEMSPNVTHGRGNLKSAEKVSCII